MNDEVTNTENIEQLDELSLKTQGYIKKAQERKRLAKAGEKKDQKTGIDREEILRMARDAVAKKNVKEETDAASSLHPAARPVVDDPKAKIEYMTNVIGQMHAMRKDDLVKWYNETMAQFGPGKDYGVGDNIGKNQDSVDMHPSDAVASRGPKTRMEMPKLGMREDVEEMLAGQDLSEEFKEKATTIFEAAVSARIITEMAKLEEEFDELLEEAVTEINEELTEKVDSYLDYVAEQWMKENEVAIESTLRSELTADLVDGLRNLFAEHNVNIPEDKVDVVEALAKKVEILEAKLDEQINEKSALEEQVIANSLKEILEEITKDLTLAEQEKFKSFATGIEFTGDIDAYQSKLSVIKENYFGKKVKTPGSTNIESETFEINEEVTTNVDPMINRYAAAISRTVKNQ